VALDLGANVIRAVAVDAAGNSGSDSVNVTRDDTPAPSSHLSGYEEQYEPHQVIKASSASVTAAAAQSLTVNARGVTFDSAGAFASTGSPSRKARTPSPRRDRRAWRRTDASATLVLSMAPRSTSTARVTSDRGQRRVRSNGSPSPRVDSSCRRQ